MRLIKNEEDLKAYENAFEVGSNDYKVGASWLPSYPYFLSISSSGTVTNKEGTFEIFHYHAFTIDDAWKLMWTSAEMKTQEGK